MNQEILILMRETVRQLKKEWSRYYTPYFSLSFGVKYTHPFPQCETELGKLYKLLEKYSK